MTDDGPLRTARRALSEVLIIVAGVLIALAVDGWSTHRAEERTERTYLGSLLQDVELDLTQIDSANAVIRRRQDRARAALEAVRSELPVVDTLRFVEDLNAAALLWTYEPQASTFEDLKSTGNLQLVRNVELRRALAEYYNVPWLDFDAWVQEVFWTRYRPALYSHVDASDIADQFYAPRAPSAEPDLQHDSAIPDIDIAGLRRDEDVRRSLEMIILTMSQQLLLLADQRDKGVILQETLESSLR